MKVRGSRRKRGNSILAVMVITLLVNGVVLVVLMASSTLKEQSAANIEREASRNEARSGVSLIAAYLNQRLNAASAPLPPAAGWVKDADNVEYFVIFGRANGAPNCTLDTGKTLTTPGKGSTVSTRTDWTQAARAYVVTHTSSVTFVARLEVVGDYNTRDWYYRVWSVAATDDRMARSGFRQAALVSQAALVPYNRLPFQVGGLTGLQGVIVKGSGTLGTLNNADGNTQPVISTNKNITAR